MYLLLGTSEKQNWLKGDGQYSTSITIKLVHSIFQTNKLPLTLDESLTPSFYKYRKRQVETITVVLNFIHKLQNILLSVLTK